MSQSPSQLDPHRFAMQLAQLSRSWRAELDRRLVGLGLSQARWLVLLHLSRFAELPTQRELAQSVGVEGPTLARLLDSLEAQGLVTRQAVPEDRRAKKIALSPPAQPLIEKIEAISTQLRKELFAGIDEEELRRCQQVHARILGNLEKR
ncbi:MarR family transcriptional regulator [Pseudomonas sp.]|jgi:MarR family transcriptional regulator for hemolysin|uniref:MarR family transcriptional regulator n=1 Tax=Pseudomonas sp. TaxID=306 RepID=UPI00271C0CA6|nr:MarR family transcriptional regulator [Pseudomonas sp.]MDO9623513.1 MarR family transcriptional regulator [Pseudomonas sp.]MDP2245527.1 MarR family transcriptional regulator [Pseudomonas sp.]